MNDDAGLGFGDGSQQGFRGGAAVGTRTRIWRGLVTVTRTLARRLRFLVRGALCVVLMAVVEWRVDERALVGIWQYGFVGLQGAVARLFVMLACALIVGGCLKQRTDSATIHALTQLVDEVHTKLKKGR